MRVSIPFRYFAHGRAKGARRSDLHCVGETKEIEVPHLSASDQMEIRSPNLLVSTVSLPVAHGAVWHPVSGVDDTPVTSTDEARTAALVLAEGHRMGIPIRPTFPPSGVPTTPENSPVGIRNPLVLDPGSTIGDRIVDVTASNREIRRRQALYDAQYLAVVDGVLCTSRYEPLFRVFRIDQDPTSNALHCEMAWYDRRTGMRGRYLPDLNERSMQGPDLASCLYGTAHDLPALISMPSTLTSSGPGRSGPHYDLRIVGMPAEYLAPGFDPLVDIDRIVLNLTLAKLAGLFHSSKLPMAPKAVVEMALHLVSEAMPSPVQPPERLVDAQWWIEETFPQVDGERLASSLATIVDAFRAHKVLSATADVIETIQRDRDLVIQVVSAGREETPDPGSVPILQRIPAPIP